MLQIDSSKLTSEVRYEAAAPVGDKQTSDFSQQPDTKPIQFPHLYGTVDFAAVAQELAVQRSADGTFLSIDGL